MVSVDHSQRFYQGMDANPDFLRRLRHDFHNLNQISSPGEHEHAEKVARIQKDFLRLLRRAAKLNPRLSDELHGRNLRVLNLCPGDAGNAGLVALMDELGLTLREIVTVDHDEKLVTPNTGLTVPVRFEVAEVEEYIAALDDPHFDLVLGTLVPAEAVLAVAEHFNQAGFSRQTTAAFSTATYTSMAEPEYHRFLNDSAMIANWQRNNPHGIQIHSTIVSNTSFSEMVDHVMRPALNNA